METVVEEEVIENEMTLDSCANMHEGPEDVETVGVFELDPVALQQQIKAKKVILLRCDVRCYCNCNCVELQGLDDPDKRYRKLKKKQLLAKILYH
ncbi:unnamed protein product [Sphagnum troendelagicum]|uniref:Uncharacterized protein n=1 Tax=Sphagnum troendelagicum TaxID=128251 RepID=A0ABP0U4Z7_9BRYO